jgi:hypothetical protein
MKFMGTKGAHVQGCWTKDGILQTILVMLYFRVSSFSVPYGPSCSISATSQMLQRTCLESKARELGLSLCDSFQKKSFGNSFSDEWDELSPPSTSQIMQELRNIPLFTLHQSFPAQPERAQLSSEDGEERSRCLVERLHSGLLDRLWQEPATQPARYLCGPSAASAVSASTLSTCNFIRENSCRIHIDTFFAIWPHKAKSQQNLRTALFTCSQMQV